MSSSTGEYIVPDTMRDLFRDDYHERDSVMSYYHSPSGGDDGEKLNSLIELLSRTFSGGGTICLFDGEYTADTTIHIRSGVYLVGQGSGRSTKGVGTVITSTAEKGITFEHGVRSAQVTTLNLHMKGPKAETGIYMSGARENRVTDVWVTFSRPRASGKFYGVHINGGKRQGCYVNTLEHVHTVGCNTGIYIDGDGTKAKDGRRRANSNALIRCRTDSCVVGVELKKTDQTSFFGHHAESNTEAGLKLSKGVARTNLFGDYYENRSTGGVDLNLTGAAKGPLGVVKAFGIRKGRLTDPNGKLVEY